MDWYNIVPSSHCNRMWFKLVCMTAPRIGSCGPTGSLETTGCVLLSIPMWLRYAWRLPEILPRNHDVVQCVKGRPQCLWWLHLKGGTITQGDIAARRSTGYVGFRVFRLCLFETHIEPMPVQIVSLENVLSPTEWAWNSNKKWGQETDETRFGEPWLVPSGSLDGPILYLAYSSGSMLVKSNIIGNWGT